MGFMDKEKLADSGLLSLLMIAAYHGIAADQAMLQHEFGAEAFSTEKIILAAKHLGMKARVIQQDAARLDRAPLPAIAIDREGHYFIAAKFDAGKESSPKILIQRPEKSPEVLNLQEFLDQWSGRLIFFTSRASYVGDIAKFDFSWFIPSIIKYRKLLSEVLLVSFVLQIIGLATPLFFQVVMDKVLVNHAMTTLNVIAKGIDIICRTSGNALFTLIPKPSPAVV